MESDWFQKDVKDGVYRPPSSPVYCMDGPRAGRVYLWFNSVSTFTVTTPDFDNAGSLLSMRMVAHRYDIVTMWGTLVRVAFYKGVHSGSY